MSEDLLPVATAQDRQTDRLSHIPAVYRSPLERMACELATEMEEPGVVFQRYGYDEARAVELMETAHFTDMLARIGKEVRESGLTFKLKARAQAEELLGHSFEIATDPLQPTSERVKLIQWTAKMAGLEPKEKEVAGAGGGGFSLNITFAGSETAVNVVKEAPLTIEQGA